MKGVRAKFRAPAGLLALGVPALLCACGDSGASGPMDVVIEGGRVVDGTGAAWFHGDVGIRGDRIAAVTPAGGLAGVDAGTRVDASGKVVAPGFIDILSHARGPLLNGDGRLLGKITQGITTEIMGEGWTNAPANANTDAGAGLVDPEIRQRIHDEVLADTADWENLGVLSTPEGVMITAVAEVGPDGEPTGAGAFVGMRVAEVAEQMGVDWVDAAIEVILMTGGQAGMIVFMMDEANVALQLQQPWIKIGTDASGFDPDSAIAMVHPRSYGTYPRILGKYVRDEGVVTLEDAIRKMTSAVATRLSIQDRGLLRAGMYADVVVFDPATVGDRATFEDPHQLSVGVEEVFVNGVAVLRGAEHTGAKPGRIVRGPGYRPAG